MELEAISEQLRIPGSKALGPIMGSVRKSHSILKNDQAKIVRDFAPDKKARVYYHSFLGMLYRFAVRPACCVWQLTFQAQAGTLNNIR